MGGATVSISDLYKSFGDFKAVDGVSIDIASGEFVTLLGLSGSGKTTTLMAIAGFVTPESGTIAIDGRDIKALPPEKRGLGVVFQNYALFPNLDVYENIAFPLKMRSWKAGDIKAAVDQVLEVVSLGGLGTRKVSELSGGQQQRVALARALVFRPPVLLMDEPLGALDRTMRDQLQTEIKRIQREFGVTVVYVTHDQEEAMALSDRIAVMANGKICQIGAPDAVYERPNSAFVAQFVGDSNRLDLTSMERVGPALRAGRADGAGGTFLASPVNAVPGMPVVMIVRPEAITLATQEPTDADNRLAGTIELREFLGATIRYSLTTALGSFSVSTARLADQAAFSAGDRVWLSWKAQDALLFDAKEMS